MHDSAFMTLWGTSSFSLAALKIYCTGAHTHQLFWPMGLLQRFFVHKKHFEPKHGSFLTKKVVQNTLNKPQQESELQIFPIALKAQPQVLCTLNMTPWVLELLVNQVFSSCDLGVCHLGGFGPFGPLRAWGTSHCKKLCRETLAEATIFRNLTSGFLAMLRVIVIQAANIA